MSVAALRPYQSTIKQRVYDALRTHRRVLMQLPTGAGKTHIMASVAADGLANGRAVLILVHRIELVDQTVEKLRAYGVNAYAITAATRSIPDADCYVAMVQTLARRTPPLVNLVMIDEAHHATAAQYRTITDQLEHAKILGVTATPVRLGGQGLADVFDDIVVGPSVKELITIGALTPTRIAAAPLRDGGAGLAQITTSGGDYNQRGLQMYCERSIIHGDLVDSYRTFVPDGRVILYAASVELSQRYVNEYRSAGIPAAHIDGATPPHERARILQAFRTGACRVVSNCSLITEGFDVPDCDAVQIARPTKSLALWLQMAGRCMRPAPSKQYAVIIDHAGNALRHGSPELDREWTLTPTRKKEKLPPLVSVDLGLEQAERRGPEHDSSLRLQWLEQTEPPHRIKDPELRKLIRVVETKNYLTKAGKLNYLWAYNKWLEKINRIPTEDEVKSFQKYAKYHPQWYTHQVRISA